MADFIVKNLINGKLTWTQVETGRIYCKYADVARMLLDEKDYRIDADGNCVKA